MARRKYRKSRSMAGSILSDTAYIANRFSWRGALALGVVQFVIFYWLVPGWITHQLDSLKSNIPHQIMVAAFSRRLHWFQWLAIALALICGFFAIRNYFADSRLDRYGERQVGLLSRLLARWFD